MFSQGYAYTTLNLWLNFTLVMFTFHVPGFTFLRQLWLWTRSDV